MKRGLPASRWQQPLRALLKVTELTWESEGDGCFYIGIGGKSKIPKLSYEPYQCCPSKAKHEAKPVKLSSSPAGKRPPQTPSKPSSPSKLPSKLPVIKQAASKPSPSKPSAKDNKPSTATREPQSAKGKGSSDVQDKSDKSKKGKKGFFGSEDGVKFEGGRASVHGVEHLGQPSDVVDFLLYNQTFNSNSYCKILKRLRRAVQNHRRGLLSYVINIAWSYIITHMHAYVQMCTYTHTNTVSGHLTYSHVLALKNYGLSIKLNYDSGEKYFADHKELQQTVTVFLYVLAADMYDEDTVCKNLSLSVIGASVLWFGPYCPMLLRAVDRLRHPHTEDWLRMDEVEYQSRGLTDCVRSREGSYGDLVYNMPTNYSQKL
ncbi:hypothetical protein PR048_023534 [Dryococelus australis]|uniref:Uncharacterized protein n=1 Tax=Dryococelus australis TaxID=614101 RepID=A0ABQ9GUC7_9NEOP|nr:hypothetical protein PR048_023534 [Dryococelus australis]